MRPFLFRFAELLPEQATHAVRYDSCRQISQVLIEGEWIDGPDAPSESMPATRVTATQRETTDDA